MAEEVFPWLKSLPLAPEYHPTLNEFQDPIAYIFKIEEEASKYGICKIVPPVSGSPKKTIIANLNRSLSARNPDSSPTFTTRQQQMGFCPRKHQRPVHKSVWQSGETFTVPQFEVKAKSFEKNYAKKGSNSKKGLSALEVETLYWKAHMDKPFSIDYANDMPGSAFDPMSGGGGGGTKQGRKEIGDAMTVGETPWNMRGVSRAKGSLLKFMKEEIPGVTSPMVYISMLFSWFAWHVEDHDLHSLNYMHMGAGKTWYGVPRDAAPSFEDVIRTHGYGGEINPIVTFATLGEKTTIMSPEVLLNLGVPCCRLVQNAGEFVVTFPRAYHSGFSHGFSCGEAANIATPGGLRVARDAAIRRASINCAPMVSHFQMLYDLAISLSSRVPTSVRPEPRSSRLKDRLKAEGEGLVKRLFLEDMMQNNELLHVLAKGSPIVFFSEDALDGLASSDSCFRSQSNASPRLSLGFCTQDNESKSRGSFASDDVVPDTRPRSRKYSSFGSEHEKKPDPGFFSCVTCGVVCYACVAIVQPTEAAAQYLKSADCSGISDLVAATDFFTVNEDAGVMDPNSSSGKMPKSAPDGLFDVPIDSADQMQAVDDSMNTTSATGAQEVNSSLGLLALAYGDSSDSGEDDDVERDIHVNNSCDLSLSIDNDAGDQTEGSVRSKCNNFVMESNRSMGRFEYQIQVPHSERELSNAHESKASIGKAITPVGNRPMNPARDADTSRMHVFCLPHAVEAEQRLRLIGGAHMLILCHQEFPKLDIEASFMANELGMDYICTDLVFREIKKQDKERIQSALDIDEATHGNQDWTVKLGIDIFYSARLSQSSLYRKQMPYNSVIYNAFGHCSPSTDPTKPKPLGRQKKIIVAGKWCGKVWMSNQAHPLLVLRDVEEQEHHETDVSAFSKADVKLEKQSQSTQAVVISKYVRKRKKNATTETVKVKFPKAESSSPPSADELPLHGGFRRQRRTNLRNKQMRKGTAPHPRNVVDKKAGRIGMDSEDDRDSGSNRSLRRRIIKPPSRDFEPKQKAKQQRRTKKAKKAPAVEPREIEEEGEFACDVEGCNMSFDSKQDLMAHKKNVCPVEGCGKKFFSHKYLVQHRRVHMDSRPLDCPWKGCSMTFKWAWARTEHIRVHTGARPYTCKEEGCGQTFRFVSDFSRHKRKTGHSVKK